MRGFARRTRLTGAPIVFGSILACTASPEPSPTLSRSLVVRVDTDLAVPKDIDHVEVRTLSGKNLLESKTLDLRTAGVTLPNVYSFSKLPPAGATVTVQAVALLGTDPRVFSEVRSEAPATGMRGLRIKLSYMCLGAKSFRLEGGSVVNACPVGQTCLGGSCQGNRVEGPSSEDSPPALEVNPSCFPALPCFEGLSLRSPTLEDDRCILHASPPPSSSTSIALVPASSSLGECGPGGRCYVPLDDGTGPTSVRWNGNEWELPRGACDPQVEGVVLSQRCPSKTRDLPLCGPRSPATTPVAVAGGDPLEPEGAQGPPKDDAKVLPPGDALPDGKEPNLGPGYVSGTLNAVDTEGLVLVLNRHQRLDVPVKNTRFAFPEKLPEGAIFKVEIKSMPLGASCSVQGGEGRADGSGSEKRVAVTCGPAPKVLKLASGKYHTCALLESGAMRCWGYASEGQLGGSSPTTSVPGLGDIVDIGAAEDMTCALRRTGELRCWGVWFDFGPSVGTPLTSIPGVETAASTLGSLSVSFDSACTVLADSGVSCWGRHGFYQQVTPVGTGSYQPPGLSGILMVTHTPSLAYALKSDGTVAYFGAFEDNAQRRLPTYVGSQVLDGLSGVVAIDARTPNICAVLHDGTVRCWSERGEPSKMAVQASTPIGGLTGVATVKVADTSASDDLGFFIRYKDGRSGWFGKSPLKEPLAYDPELSREELVDVSGSHACAYGRDRTVRCWGAEVGQLSSIDPIHLDVKGLTGVVAIGAGLYSTCVATQEGSVQCWGMGMDYETPSMGVTTVGTGLSSLSPIETLAVGNGMYCALRRDHSARCWFLDSFKDFDYLRTVALAAYECLVNKEGVAQECAGTVKGLSGVVAMETSPGRFEDNYNPFEGFQCSVLEDTTVRCSELGLMRGVDPYAGSSLTTSIPGLSGVKKVAVGNGHACALLENGTVRCWGANTYGQTAGGSPVTPIEGLRDVVDLQAGTDHTCVLLPNGTVRCWGRNVEGQTAGSSPSRPVPFVNDAKAIAVGGRHTCALFNDGRVLCWGDNTYGQSSGEVRPPYYRVPLGP